MVQTQRIKTIRPIQNRYGPIIVSLVDCWDSGARCPDRSLDNFCFCRNSLNTCPIEQRAVNPVKSIGDFTMYANHEVGGLSIGIGNHTHEKTTSRAEVMA